ncbi:hypothetical protein ACRFB9_28410, partial [Klebsiella pneumoniae]
NYLLNIFNIKKINQIILKTHYTIYKHTNITFNQSFPPLIHPHPYFSITKNKYPSSQILLQLKHQKILTQIQHKFPPSLKLTSPLNPITYTLQNKQPIIKLINPLNPNIPNTKTLLQFNKLSILLNIHFKQPIKLTKHNPSFIPFFHPHPTINYYYSPKLKITPQLTITLTNKYLHHLQYYTQLFPPNIYFHKPKNPYFKSSINNKQLHNIFYLYNKTSPSKSNKPKPLFLIYKFYYLY